MDELGYLRLYLNSPEGEGGRRLIVRAGELLIGVPPESEGKRNEEHLRALEAEVRISEGIAFDPVALEWRADVPVVGYLEGEEGTGLRVVPIVRVSEDRVSATLDLRAPASGEQPVTRAEVDAAIEEARLAHGLSESRVEGAWRMFESSGALASPLRIASGVAPVAPRTARVDYLLTVNQTVGEMNEEDGTLDFHEQHLIINVDQGQDIGVWHPPVEGASGMGVDGKEIPVVVDDDEKHLRVGDNIVRVRQGDGSVLLRAGMDGMLILADDGGPSVSDVFELPGDVDFATGNLEARGSIIIGGTVRSDFRVQATKDITVLGAVEGADLKAGGNIKIEGGLIGERGRKIVAGGNMILKYSQNAYIECAGSVDILDSDTRSTIECGGRLTATDGKGRLQGGGYFAGITVLARELGSDLGAPTLIRVGTDPLREREAMKVRAELKKLRKVELQQRRNTASAQIAGNGTPAKGGNGAAAVLSMKEIAAQRSRFEERLSVLERELESAEKPVVGALTKVFCGVDLMIRRSMLHIEEPMGGHRFTVDPESGEIISQRY